MRRNKSISGFYTDKRLSELASQGEVNCRRVRAACVARVYEDATIWEGVIGKGTKY